jgi:hypothetical protein
MRLKDKLNIYALSLIVNSYASIVPDNIKYFNDLAPELHEKLMTGIKPETFRMGEHMKNPNLIYDLIPDLTTYNNLWLAITCFGIKANIMSKPLEA